MVASWMIVSVVVAFLLACPAVLFYYAREIAKRESILEETLWVRRHKIPLLVESVKLSSLSGLPIETLIKERSEVSSGAYELEEVIIREKQISDLLHGIFLKTQEEASLKNDATFLSLKKEFHATLEQIRIALNDYNFSVEKWRMQMRRPWFRIFEFAFGARKKKPLSLV